jgi:glycosyltransferase involved in cell wall biosynthesis
MPPGKLTAIVTTFNEEDNILECLSTLPFADEILVVDSFSTDRTVELARGVPKVRLLQHEYAGNGPQCNWAMDQAAHDWILIVDADERVTPPLAAEIRELMEKGPSADHYLLRRDNVFVDRVIRHAGWGRDRLVRLVKRGTVRYPEQRVHADMSPDGPTPTLRAPLLHYTLRSLPQYLEKLHRYADWGARDLAGRGRGAGFKEIALRPAWRFLRMYLLEAGFLDGLHGFAVCALQSYGVFLKWARLWELSRQAKSPPGNRV